MTKIGKKRSRANVDDVQENIPNMLSRMESNNSINSSQDLHGEKPNDDGKAGKKKGRGASKLKMVTGQQKCKELERNEFGQPVGDNSVKYASFLGGMVKEFVPYTLDGWNAISEDIKDKMWECLQILVREVNAGRGALRDIGLLKSEFMDQNQWDLFVKRTLSPTFQEKSARFREMRVKQNYNHTMSRRGYARLTQIMKEKGPENTNITRAQVWIEGHKKKNGEPSTQVVGEKMKEIEECPLDSQNTTNIAEDAVSLVFGKEARGRVRGMGFGVTPSKVGASVQQNGTVKQIRQEMQEMKSTFNKKIEEMMSIFLQKTSQQNQLKQIVSGGLGSGIGNEVGSNSNIHIGAKKSGDYDDVTKNLETAQSNLKNGTHGAILANTKCKLLHWHVDRLIVAEGRIASTDPNTKVHHVVLGESCWKVWVDKVLVENVDLIRPNDEMRCLDDAIGSTVAWLSKLIILCD